MQFVRAGSANTVGADLVKRSDTTALTTGTVTFYLVARRGDNAGRWFKAADDSWSATEITAGTSDTPESEGHWTVEIAAAAWTAGMSYRLYATHDGSDYVTYSDDILCLTAAGSWPDADDSVLLSLAEIKTHLRIDTDYSDEDDTLLAYIDAATTWAEHYNGRKFIQDTCVEVFDAFPTVFRPRWSPLVSVTSIQYIDTAGATQTLDSGVYDLDTTTEPGRIALAHSQRWPSIRSDINAVTLTYVAGEAAAGADVPQIKRHAVAMIVGSLYENREDASPIAIKTVPFGARQLLNIDRLMNV